MNNFPRKNEVLVIIEMFERNEKNAKYYSKL